MVGGSGGRGQPRRRYGAVHMGAPAQTLLHGRIWHWLIGHGKGRRSRERTRTRAGLHAGLGTGLRGWLRAGLGASLRGWMRAGLRGGGDSGLRSCGQRRSKGRGRREGREGRWLRGLVASHGAAVAGSKVGHWVSLNQPVELVQGLNKLTLLSEIVGLQNYGAFLEKDGAGFRGQVKLTGFPNGNIDLTKSLWTYQIGLKGEFLKIYSPENQGCAKWSSMQNDDTQTPFTWFKTMFDAPEGNDPVAIGLGSMGKGQAWVNGHLIGRYWSLVAPESGCPSCNYAGAYSDSKCQSNCGMPTQSWY
nr:unnamed protein product [Digitaria exilis]